MRPIRRMILHCAATRPTHDVTAAEIRRWHVEDRKWSDIGYHYLIRRNGAVEYGRTVPTAGAHVRGHNHDSIGICLAGGHGSDADDQFSDHFTEPQRISAQSLIASLRHAFGSLPLHGHNEFSAKACPGFRVNGGAGLEAIRAETLHASAPYTDNPIEGIS